MLVVLGEMASLTRSSMGSGSPDLPRMWSWQSFPLRTGNDLAATLKVPLDPAEAIKTIRAERFQPLDMIQVRS